MMNLPPIISRRSALQAAACGFGYLALAGLAGRNAAMASAANPLAMKLPHFAARAKRVIFLFMQGGVSHVDSFDYKPELFRLDGRNVLFDNARKIANKGERGTEERI